ncbi:flavodoxin family protein [Streptomyces lushanensis]|uniref:flavodoxin family protein n=1 Tax=Streptomyces lushanensis TaxID=1434255 RepID=UPI000833E18C|nr:NAD(P)H-dependent oxidoreductase [Streptomyces lushanensis]
MTEAGRAAVAGRVLDEPRARSFAFMLGSPRVGGATELLARRAAEGLPAEAERSWLRLSGLHHSGVEGFGPSSAALAKDDDRPDGDRHERLLLDATLEHTDIVVVSPLYWYSVSAQTKLYLDHWAAWMSHADLDFRGRMRGKTLWAVSTFARGQADDAEPLVGMLRRTARYLDMRWGGALLHQARSTGELADQEVAHHAAAFFGPAHAELRSH